MTYRNRCAGRKKRTQKFAVIIDGVEVGTTTGMAFINPNRATVKFHPEHKQKAQFYNALTILEELGLFNADQTDSVDKGLAEILEKDPNPIQTIKLWLESEGLLKK